MEARGSKAAAKPSIPARSNRFEDVRLEDNTKFRLMVQHREI